MAELRRLLKQPDVTKAIVFVRKRERLHELVSWLHKANIRNCYLEGEMVQAKRNEAVNRLLNNIVNVLVATDVAARGLDIPDISHVINFDLPKTADTYLHRIGRTGRAGKKGIALSLVESHDYPLLLKIERYLQEPIKIRVIDSLKPETKTPKIPAKKKISKKAKEKAIEKKKQQKVKMKIRHRDKKNIGKRRKPSSDIQSKMSSDVS